MVATAVAAVGTIRAEVAAVREQKIRDELDVDGPITWVVEDEDGVDFQTVLQAGRSFGLIEWLWEREDFLFGIVLAQRVKGKDLGVCRENIGWGDDRGEAVALGDAARSRGVGAEHEDGRVAQVLHADLVAEVRDEFGRVGVVELFEIFLGEQLVGRVTLDKVGCVEGHVELVG